MVRFARMGSALAAVALALSALSVPTPVRAADYILDYTDPGPCADQRVLGRIVDRFRHQTRNVPALPLVDIMEFHQIYEQRRLVPTEDWPIGRHYCGATVVLSDGDSRPIWYLIEAGMGFAGLGDNVEFCLSGFDRWFVYNAHCRVLR